MNELNLIPYGIKQKKQRVFIIRQYIAYAIILICILFMGLYIPNFLLHQFKNQEQRLLDQVNENKAAVRERELIATEIENYNNKIKVIDTLINNKIKAADKIRELEQYTPTDVKVLNMNYNSTGITIQGTAGDYNSTAEFAANLEMSKKYKQSKIISISKDNAINSYIFTIELRY